MFKGMEDTVFGMWSAHGEGMAFVFVFFIVTTYQFIKIVQIHKQFLHLFNKKNCRLFIFFFLQCLIYALYILYNHIHI